MAMDNTLTRPHPGSEPERVGVPVQEGPSAIVPDGGGACRDRFHLTSGTELIGEYQGSGFQEPRYLIRRSDGQLMQLPRLLYQVASSLDGRSTEQIAAEVGPRLGQPLTAEDVRFLVEERLSPAGIIARVPAADPRDVTAAIDGPLEPDAPLQKPDPLLLALRYRVGVLGPGVAWRIGGVFRLLFFRPVWVGVLGTFAALLGLVAARGNLGSAFVDGVLTVSRHPVLVLGVLGLALVSATFHECGHVTACRYGGAVPGPIGIGIYLVWPSFYSTVTDSYRLNRTGRLRTDLGGVYFNTVFMTGTAATYLATGQTWLLVALAAMLFETLYQFLPSIRLDGYYMLSDLVGVPELFSYVKPVLRSILPRHRTDPRVHQLRPWARRLIVLWVSLVVPVLTICVCVVVLALPSLIPALRPVAVAYLEAAATAVHAGDVLSASLVMVQLVFFLLPWVGLALTVWTLVSKCLRVVGSRAGVRPAVWAAARSWAAVALVAATGVALVVRVARGAGAAPPTAAERTLTDGAFASLRGLRGSSPAPPGDWLLQQQLTGWTRLTGAFDRHADVLSATREVGPVATGVLVLSLVTLVLVRRVPPLAVGLPLAAVLAMGPAVTLLTTVGPVPVACAWLALGVLLICVQSWTGIVLGGLAALLGLATAPLLAAPLVGLAVASFLVRRPGGSLQWWPARFPTGAPVAPSATAGPRHRAPPARRFPPRWMLPAGALLVGALAVLLGADGAPAPLPPPDRTAVLLSVSVVAIGGIGVRRLRPVGIAVACAIVLAVVPWGGAGTALVLALICALPLAVFLVDAAVRPPVAERAHPLLRTAVALPAGVAVLVAALFAAPASSPVAHRALATWLATPAAAEGTVAVPRALWADLVRDGVPASRLVDSGTPAAQRADWSVGMGAAGGSAGKSTVVGSGAGALTVSRTPAAQADLRARSADESAAQAAAQRALVEQRTIRQALGTLLARRPQVVASADLRTALSAGAVDQRVLSALAGLTADYSLGLGLPDGGPAPGPDDVVDSVVVTTLDGRQATAATADRLIHLLQSAPAGLAPTQVTAGPGGVIASWASSEG